MNKQIETERNVCLRQRGCWIQCSRVKCPFWGGHRLVAIQYLSTSLSGSAHSKLGLGSCPAAEYVPSALAASEELPQCICSLGTSALKIGQQCVPWLNPRNGISECCQPHCIAGQPQARPLIMLLTPHVTACTCPIITFFRSLYRHGLHRNTI